MFPSPQAVAASKQASKIIQHAKAAHSKVVRKLYVINAGVMCTCSSSQLVEASGRSP
jgi:hypothetical protein